MIENTPEKIFKIGNTIKCVVTGDYVIETEITGRVTNICANGRLKIETPQGHAYIVHAEDCEEVFRDLSYTKPFGKY